MEPLIPGKPVLVVDFWADYGQFKKYYTTMSPLSFSLPTGTALRGMLGAICGIDRDTCPQYFADARLALRPLGPVRKANLAINLLKTTSARHFSRFQQHKPTIIEFVKHARYRCYIHLPDDDKQRALRGRLEAHHSVYTLSFGNSESLANYRYHGEERVVAVGEGKAEVGSMVPTDHLRRVDFGQRELFTITLPVTMTNERVVTRYTEFLLERNGHTIVGDFTHYNRLSNGENIVFF